MPTDTDSGVEEDGESVQIDNPGKEIKNPSKLQNEESDDSNEYHLSVNVLSDKLTQLQSRESDIKQSISGITAEIQQLSADNVEEELNAFMQHNRREQEIELLTGKQLQDQSVLNKLVLEIAQIELEIEQLEVILFSEEPLDKGREKEEGPTQMSVIEKMENDRLQTSSKLEQKRIKLKGLIQSVYDLEDLMVHPGTRLEILRMVNNTSDSTKASTAPTDTLKTNLGKLSEELPKIQALISNLEEQLHIAVEQEMKQKLQMEQKREKQQREQKLQELQELQALYREQELKEQTTLKIAKVEALSLQQERYSSFSIRYNALGLIFAGATAFKLSLLEIGSKLTQLKDSEEINKKLCDTIDHQLKELERIAQGLHEPDDAQKIESLSSYQGEEQSDIKPPPPQSEVQVSVTHLNFDKPSENELASQATILSNLKLYIREKAWSLHHGRGQPEADIKSDKQYPRGVADILHTLNSSKMSTEDILKEVQSKSLLNAEKNTEAEKRHTGKRFESTSKFYSKLSKVTNFNELSSFLEESKKNDEILLKFGKCINNSLHYFAGKDKSQKENKPPSPGELSVILDILADNAFSADTKLIQIQKHAKTTLGKKPYFFQSGLTDEVRNFYQKLSTIKDFSGLTAILKEQQAVLASEPVIPPTRR